jgi:hypothetical protein
MLLQRGLRRPILGRGILYLDKSKKGGKERKRGGRTVPLDTAMTGAYPSIIRRPEGAGEGESPRRF